MENLELLDEDSSDTNQTAPFPIKEEGFLDLVEEEDVNDMILLAIISIGGLIIISMCTLIFIFCCKRKTRYEQVENGNPIPLKNLQRHQKLISDMVAKATK